MTLCCVSSLLLYILRSLVFKPSTLGLGVSRMGTLSFLLAEENVLPSEEEAHVATGTSFLA